MNPLEVEKARAQLRLIVKWTAEDAERLDGAPLSGPIVGVHIGETLAAISRLAKVIESLLPPEVEPERDPVPFVDYFPEPVERTCLDTGCGPGGSR